MPDEICQMWFKDDELVKKRCTVEVTKDKSAKLNDWMWFFNFLNMIANMVIEREEKSFNTSFRLTK